MRRVILALLLSAAAWAQPVNPPPAILKGNPPGGAGGACVASNLIGYLTSTGTQYLCPSGTNVWTAVASSGGSAPTGPAGGALSGTYPDPGVANPLPTTNLSATGILQVGAPVTTTPFVNPFSTPTFTYAGNGGEFVGSGLNDMALATATSGYTGAAPAAFIVRINATGTPDTVVWAKNNGSFSSPINITGGSQTLGSEGLKVQFLATTGHTAGDYWVVPTLAGALWPSTASETGHSGASAALAGSGSGSVTNGVHAFKTTWVTSTGETYAASAGSATVANNAVNGKISITSIPQASSALALGANIWATKAGGSTYYLAAFVPKGTTSFTFNTADSALVNAAPAYFDNVTTAGGCTYGEDAGLGFGSCGLQFFDYGVRFPLGGAGRNGAYFFDGFPNGLLGTSGNYLTQLTALPSATTATTQSPSDNSGKVATTAYVDAAFGGGTSVSSPYVTVGAAKYGPVLTVTAPPSTGWSWANQGSSTVASVNGALLFSFTQNNVTDNIRCYMRNLPASTGYTADIGLLSVAHAVGIAISDGTKYVLAWQNSVSQILAYQWNTSTSVGSQYFSATIQGNSSPLLYMRVQDTGGTRKFYLCADSDTCYQLDSQTTATFLTETQYGLCYETNQPTNGNVKLVHASATAP